MRNFEVRSDEQYEYHKARFSHSPLSLSLPPCIQIPLKPWDVLQGVKGTNFSCTQFLVQVRVRMTANAREAGFICIVCIPVKIAHVFDSYYRYSRAVNNHLQVKFELPTGRTVQKCILKNTNDSRKKGSENP